LSLSGTVLSGGKSATRDRVEDDFYATPVDAVFALLDREPLYGSLLEPACGSGHIIKAVKLFYPDMKIHGSDIVRRNDVFNLFSSGGGRLFLKQIFLALILIKKDLMTT